MRSNIAKETGLIFDPTEGEDEDDAEVDTDMAVVRFYSQYVTDKDRCRFLQFKAALRRIKDVRLILNEDPSKPPTHRVRWHGELVSTLARCTRSQWTADCGWDHFLHVVQDCREHTQAVSRRLTAPRWQPPPSKCRRGRSSSKLINSINGTGERASIIIMVE